MDAVIGISIFVGVFVVAITLKLLIGNAIKNRKQKRKQIANKVARPILEEFFGSDMVYEPDKRIPDELIAASGFVDEYDTISGSDFVRGHYKGVPIMFSDLHLQQTREVYDPVEKEEEITYVTMFKGFWVVADFDRVLTSVPLKIKGGRDRSAIQMESDAFNGKFGVHCPDEHVAFYILTPHFMERLLEIRSRASGNMFLKLHENRMQFAVYTHEDQFEIGFFKKPDLAEMDARFRKEVKQITDVFDEILQHERLFGKEESSPGT